jgi:hypothetical protein
MLEEKKRGDLTLYGNHISYSVDLLLVGALPTWPYSSSWGYYPSGGLGLVLLIIIIFVLLGRV